jgi:SAM-dependent methyltransferase
MFFRSTPRLPRLLRRAAISTTTAATLPLTTSSSTPSSLPKTIPPSQIKPFTPKHEAWPYNPREFSRLDENPDTGFYDEPRYVAHIDDAALERLKSYFSSVLPRKGRVLDFCTAWNSWFPEDVNDAVARGELEVFGLGMNADELKRNHLLNGFEGRTLVRDLNVEPYDASVGWAQGGGDVDGMPKFDAATCTVSIDYLVEPVKVLESVKRCMSEGGTVHLVISNRCFPTKAVKIWLELDTDQRLQLVGGKSHDIE